MDLVQSLKNRATKSLGYVFREGFRERYRGSSFKLICVDLPCATGVKECQTYFCFPKCRSALDSRSVECRAKGL